MASGPTTSWQIDGEKVEIVTDFIFLGPKIAVDFDCSRGFSSVQLSSVAQSWSHESQLARPRCPSPTPGVYPNSYPAISSCVVSFSSCPQSLPSSGSFPISQPFAWGGQSKTSYLDNGTLYLVHGHSYTTLYIYQKSWNFSLKTGKVNGM